MDELTSMLMRKLHIVLTMLVPALSGCIEIPMRDMTRPIDLQHSYKTPIATETPQNQPLFNAGWWKLYDDEELNALIEHAFVNNPNLKQVQARLSRAQALAKQSKSSLLPRLDATVERGTTNSEKSTLSDFLLASAASFEIDLWGKNKATHKSDQLEAKASKQDLHSASITLSASIVENWLDILSLLEQENLIRKQIEVNRTVLELQQKRFEMGSSGALDILQQEEILAKSESELPDIISSQKQAANNIALLIGNTPLKGLKVSEKPFPDPLPIPEAGLPSELLENRPDIIAAWLRLLSADWATKAAWANRLPNFDLTATYSTTATKINSLFNTWLLDLAASLTAPIFDGGNRKAEQLQQKALADERYHAYRETVLEAVLEVENALVRNTYQDNKLVALKNQLEASRKTLGQAQLSYINGDRDYINVLNSLNNTQSLEQKIALEQLKQAKERVRLYRALGGCSWPVNVPVSTYKTMIHEGKKT